MNDVQEIIWDFDGVILLSDAVREYGFRKIFEDHRHEQVEELISFHKKNGGLSRYIKIRFFYEEILKTPVSDEKVNELAEQFSLIMKKELTNIGLLNPEWLGLMKVLDAKYTHSIASGSDGTELNFLCKSLGIAHHFKYITGSPTHKRDLVKQILFNSNFLPAQIVLIGDAINDRDAARDNGINFIGYHHASLKDSPFFIDNLALLPGILNNHQ